MGIQKAENESRLGWDAVYVTLSKLVMLLVGLGITMILSRFWTKEEYGTYSQIHLVVNLSISIFMLGLPNSINFFLARAETGEEKQKFLSTFYSLSTLLSFIIGMILSLCLPLIVKYFKNPHLQAYFYFFALYPWANVISSSIENLLVVYRKTRFLVVYRLINCALLFGAALAVVLIRLHFVDYIRLYLGLYILFALAVYVICYKLTGRLNISFDRRILRSTLIYSLPLGLASAVGTLNIEIDKLLIGFLMNTEQLAVYTNASKELPVTIIATSITAILLPKTASMLKHDDREGAVNLWGEATELSFHFICLLVAGLFTFAKDVISLLYSEKYLSGLPVFRVYILVLLLRSTYIGLILNSIGETKKIFYCSLITLALNMVLNPLLYMAMGMIGPAIATFLSIAIMAWVQLRMTSKCTGIRIRDIFPWGTFACSMGVNMLLALAFYALKQQLPLDHYIGSLLESLLLGLVWSVLYFLIFRRRIVSRWNDLNHS